MQKANRLLASAMAVTAPLFFSSVHAQQSVDAFPSRPVRIIIPAAPSGITDLQVRLAAEKLTKTFGQPFIVDNKAGAGTTLGTALVAKAPPDGYTMLGMTGSFMTASVIFANLPYDPIKDLTPVSGFTTSPNIFVTRPSLPVKTLQDFIQYAKTKPGIVNYATTGNGTQAHLAGLWLEKLTGIQLTYVPYKDVGQMHLDMNQGRVDATISSPTNSLNDVRSGQKHAIAWTGMQRSKLLPDLATMREQGLTEFDVSSVMGFWVTGGTPTPIVNKLSSALVLAAKDPEIAARLAPTGNDMLGSTAAQFRELVVAEIVRWRTLLKDAGVPQIPL